MNLQIARDRWQALTEGSPPRLPMEFFQVAGTFLDSTEPEILAPSEKIFSLLERHVGGHLLQLAVVALAGLASASADKVQGVLTALEQLLCEVDGLVDGAAIPDLHYREAFLQVHSPALRTWQVEATTGKAGARPRVSKAKRLARSYTKALEWTENWFSESGDDSLQVHRLQPFGDQAQWIARWLPPQLGEVIQMFESFALEETGQWAALGLRVLYERIIPSKAPWAVHLAVVYASFTPAEREMRSNANAFGSIHKLLLSKCKEGRFPDDLGELLTFSQADHKGEAVRTLNRICNLMQRNIARLGWSGLELYTLKLAVMDRPRDLGWAVLKDSLDPALYSVCVGRLQPGHPDFEFVLPAILYLSKNTTHPFYPHLVLMSLALALDPASRRRGTMLKYVRVVAVGLSKTLKRYRIGPDKFDPDQHLAPFLRLPRNEGGSAPQTAKRLRTAFHEGVQAVATFLKGEPAESPVQSWQWRPIAVILPVQPDDPEDLAAAQERQRDIDLVIRHWTGLHLLAEARTIAVRHLILAVQAALNLTPAGPFPIDIQVALPECTTLWHFRLWNTPSYVEAPRELYPHGVSRHAETPFLEWRQAVSHDDQPAVVPWFIKLLSYQNIGETLLQQSGLLDDIGYTKDAFKKVASYPCLQPGQLRRVFKVATEFDLKNGRPLRCLFEPMELYGDVLTGLLQLRILRVTGGRQHELLQLRLDPEYFEVKELGCVYRVLAKGRKGAKGVEAQLEDRYLSSRALYIVRDLLELRARYGRISDTIRPTGVALDGLSSGRYLFSTDQAVLSDKEFTRRLRFLTFGWDSVLGEKKSKMLRTHELRYGMANLLASGGFRLSTIATVLGHLSERMSAQYARQTLAQQELLDRQAGNIIETLEPPSEQAWRTGFVELTDDQLELPLRKAFVLPPLLTRLYELEDAARKAAKENTSAAQRRQRQAG